MTRKEKGAIFQQLHKSKTLVLPNAWDAASAKIVEMAGAAAIGTTSAGVSWSRGTQDGESLNRNAMIRSIEEIVAVTSLPVTADVESGYGNRQPEDVADTVRAVVEAGAVGINLEDTPGVEGHPILEPGEQAARIRKAREAGGEIFINARIDVYLANIGDPETRFDAVVDRAATYLEAGADGIFVPGLTDLQTIRALSRAIEAPLNVMAGRGSASISELQQAGVARISLGPVLALAGFSQVRKMAHEVVHHGTFSSFPNDLSFSEMDAFFAKE